MSKEDKLEQALKCVTSKQDDVMAIYRHEFKDQVPSDVFRRWMDSLKQIPAEMLPLMCQCLDMSVEEAFHRCQPNFVAPEEFRRAAVEKLEPPQGVVEQETEATPTELEVE